MILYNEIHIIINFDHRLVYKITCFVGHLISDVSGKQQFAVSKVSTDIPSTTFHTPETLDRQGEFDQTFC